MHSKKVAVILSGCGHKDGAEITEAVSTLIALSEAGATYEVFAPRNVMLEAARISRGEINDLNDLHAKNFDALAIPGGMGVKLNLFDNADAARVIKEFYDEQKPIAAICIAPALIAKVIGKKGVTLTIGDDQETAAEIEKTGAHHESCRVDDYITDRGHRIITTPAYMYAEARPFEVFSGVRKAIRELVEMA